MFGSDWLLDFAITMVELRYRVRNLTTDELAAMLAGSEPPLLFDVRNAVEYEKSHIATAILLEQDTAPDAFAARYASLAAGRDIVFYCSIGQRSSELLVRLENDCLKVRAKSCRNLRGGIFRWYNSGRPVVDGSGLTDDIDGYDEMWGMMVERRR